MSIQLNNYNFTKINSKDDFKTECLRVFQYQAKNCIIYSKYLSLLKVDPSSIKEIEQIPFLPIEFFKSTKILIGETYDKIFVSSGTGGDRSQHYVKDLSAYEASFTQSFNNIYGDISEHTILALLPSYIEQENSSLVYMVNSLMNLTDQKSSGFYNKNYKDLFLYLKSHSTSKIILFGVGYALLEFGEQFKLHCPDLIVIETGGMKGRRKEITKSKLHAEIQSIFGTKQIHSEYGMTELLSQAYSSGTNNFIPAPWMKIRIRDPYDPFSYVGVGRSGGINIIDLANIHSCSFIESKDIGILNDDESFQILGRFDHSDIRGCNLLADTE